jgi:hypothetical protein
VLFPSWEHRVFDFVVTRIETLKATLSRSPREVAVFLAVTAIVALLPGLGASVFPRAKGGVEIETVQAGPLAERIGIVVGDTIALPDDLPGREGALHAQLASRRLP